MSFSSCLDHFTVSNDRVWFDENFPDLIDSLKEEAKTKELSDQKTKTLKNAEVALMNVRNLRFL